MESPQPRFLFDRMLGRLCKKMRLLGFDSKLNPDGETGRFLINAEREGRVAVTMAKRREERPGPKPLILESVGTKEQIVELFAKLGVTPEFAPFTRCLECNEALVEENRESVRDEVPPFVARTFDEFYRCPSCNRIYWQGTHYDAMKKEIERIKKALGEIGP